MNDRPVIDVPAAVGGWPVPWPNVAEIAGVLSSDSWTLVGGLMTQVHTVHHGIGVVRPTNDVDIVLHLETSRHVPARTATALESLGYRLRPAVDPRDNTAHRFVRGTSRVDVVGSADEEVVDVLRSDHPAPRVVETLRGRDMIAIEGGTQALRRTVDARLEIIAGRLTTISVPRPFGAVILKAAAHLADSRDRDRHLYDAAALLACINDPVTERDGLAGSDGRRLRHLAKLLTGDHPAWRTLPGQSRDDAQGALRILAGHG